MKMRKLFAGLLATSMLAAGTSAFAEATANDAGYSKDAGTYSIAADLTEYGSDQMTILIIPEAAYTAGTIEDADILYIDQAAANTENIFKNVGILGGTTLADGTYYVKIGGENIAKEGIIVEKFTISSAPAYTLGDVFVDGNIDTLDAAAVLEYFANISPLTETQKLAANVFADENIDTLDAAAILEHFAGITPIK